ncbi:hypothetical protein ES703_102798 [subsurface metagenome]
MRDCGCLALIILYFIITGKINLEKLICEPNGDASMSRLQFLIFTFVIAISLYLIIIGKDPLEILILLGISGALGIPGMEAVPSFVAGILLIMAVPSLIIGVLA